LAIRIIVFDFADVFCPVCERIGALSIPSSVLEFTDVFAPNCKCCGTLPIRLTAFEFPDEKRNSRLERDDTGRLSEVRGMISLPIITF
jgi:hypothetical protein